MVLLTSCSVLQFDAYVCVRGRCMSHFVSAAWFAEQCICDSDMEDPLIYGRY